MILLTTLNLTLTTWFLAFTSAFILGVSKGGIKGIAILNVTLMAIGFGAKESTGILVPLLVVADVFAVIYYNRHTQWKYILKFLPWMIVGVFLGAYLGKDLNETTFKIGMAIVILGSVVMMYWWDRKQTKKVPSHWLFASSIGVVAGVTTMIGNLAGSFSNIFFLALRLPKNEFIGTAAWLFLIINVFKLPFHFFLWETINTDTLILNAKLIPGIILGLFVGIKLVKIIKDDFYRKMILVLTALGAIIIILQ